jgi:DNA polymerase-1
VRRASYIERYFARYPGVARYMESTRNCGQDERLRRNRLRSPPVAARDPPAQVGRRQGAERAAINAPMQGTAADLIKLAMIAVQHWLDEKQLRPSSSCRCTTNWCSKCRMPSCR